MKMTVLIATRDRCASLERCLDALSRAAGPAPIEVVVVDNRSRDGTTAFLQAYARKSAFPLLVLTEPRPGKSRALNTGLAHATGDVLAFIDDDVYVASDYVQRLVEVFDSSPVGFCGGRILLHDPTDIAVTVRTGTAAELIPPRTYIQPGTMQGCNMAFRREVLEMIGGFDPMLGPGTPFICEDVDLAARASNRGWVGGYFPQILVYHHHGRKTRADEQALMRGYSWGRGAYLAKFVITPGARLQYLKRCYWQWRSLPMRVLVQEMSGAVRYVLARLFTTVPPIPSLKFPHPDAARPPARTG